MMLAVWTLKEAHKSYPAYMSAKDSLPNASKDGGLAIATPNETQGLIELHRRFGTKSP